MMEQLDFFETLCPTCPVCNQSFKKTTHNKKYCSGTCREIKEKETVEKFFYRSKSRRSETIDGGPCG